MPPPHDLRQIRRARAIRRGGIGVLLLLLVLGASGALGTRTGTVQASGGGYDMTVTYPRVARSGLAAPFSVELRRPGGFPADRPIRVAITARYFHLFDENSLDPDPATATATPDDLIYEFDPPPGGVFVMTFDARISPSRQLGARGRVAVLEGGQRVVSADYRTWVLP